MPLVTKQKSHPYPFYTSLGTINIRFNRHRVRNLHSLAMRIHSGISPKKKINSTEIIFFKKFPSLPRHSLTSKQETKNILEKQNLTGKSDRDFKCRSTVTLKEHTFSGIIATSGLGLFNSSSRRGKIPSSGSHEPVQILPM